MESADQKKNPSKKKCPCGNIGVFFAKDGEVLCARCLKRKYGIKQ